MQVGGDRRWSAFAQDVEEFTFSVRWIEDDLLTRRFAKSIKLKALLADFRSVTFRCMEPRYQRLAGGVGIRPNYGDEFAGRTETDAVPCPGSPGSQIQRPPFIGSEISMAPPDEASRLGQFPSSVDGLPNPMDCTSSSRSDKSKPAQADM